MEFVGVDGWDDAFHGSGREPHSRNQGLTCRHGPRTNNGSTCIRPASDIL
jgi:hypothetical protein